MIVVVVVAGVVVVIVDGVAAAPHRCRLSPEFGGAIVGGLVLALVEVVVVGATAGLIIAATAIENFSNCPGGGRENWAGLEISDGPGGR